jgi:hypothetical protein
MPKGGLHLADKPPFFNKNIIMSLSKAREFHLVSQQKREDPRILPFLLPWVVRL